MNCKFNLAIAILLLLLISAFKPLHWGFFGHKRINRLAVFTMPSEIMGYYKTHIEFITNHAPDPDKRRYATKHEAHRHYIDLDQWGIFPFDSLPRYFNDALMKYAHWEVITTQQDTFRLFENPSSIQFPNIVLKDAATIPLFGKDSLVIDYKRYQAFFKNFIKTQYYEEEWQIETALLDSLKLSPIVEIEKINVADNFSEHGILPYHLSSMLYRLTKAFEEKNQTKILQLSADFGHYIGDAHVPLHTTKNYNGQLTNQVGIHAFWESRLPELFADADYDFFVGSAQYIDEPVDYFWNIVLESHLLVDSVLQIEKQLSHNFKKEEQYCYEKRGDATMKMPCKAYAKAFHEALEGMVERRMRAAILSTGSVWYTAWVDAGKPDLMGQKLMIQDNVDSLNSFKQKNNSTPSTRQHDF